MSEPILLMTKPGANKLTGGTRGRLGLFQCNACSKRFWDGVSQKPKFCSKQCYSQDQKTRPPLNDSSSEMAAKISKAHRIRNGGLITTPARKRLLTERHRLLKRNAEGSHTVGDWETLKAQYNWTCPCCGKREPEIKLSKDHIIPLVKGGSDNIENIQPLCRRCNSKKHTKTIKYITEFITKIL